MGNVSVWMRLVNCCSFAISTYPPLPPRFLACEVLQERFSLGANEALSAVWDLLTHEACKYSSSSVGFNVYRWCIVRSDLFLFQRVFPENLSRAERTNNDIRDMKCAGSLFCNGPVCILLAIQDRGDGKSQWPHLVFNFLGIRISRAAKNILPSVAVRGFNDNFRRQLHSLFTR